MVDYKCNMCGFIGEYCTSPSVPTSMKPPRFCPQCKEGLMIAQFGGNIHGGFDCIGGYDYQYGKKSLKKTNPEKYAKCLVKDQNGNYPNPY